MRGQQFLDTPAMIRDASGHRRCGLATGMGQTRMRCAESIDRPNQIHSLLQRQRAARERATPACHPPYGVRRRRRAAGRSASPPVPNADVAPRAQPRTPLGSCPDWITKGLAHRANIGAQAIGTQQQRAMEGTGAHRSISRRINVMSRCARTSPASHNRVETIMASAIQTMPPCLLMPISSACPWPRSRGCSTRCAWTAWPWRPARAPHAATVRSSNSKATTMACTGQPWASNVMISATRSPAVRRR